MKIKLLITLLALTLLAMLTACGGYETEYDLYSDADTDADYYGLYEYDDEADYEDERSPKEIALEAYNTMFAIFSPEKNGEFWALDGDVSVRVGMIVLDERVQANFDSSVLMIFEDGYTELAVIVSMDMRYPDSQPIGFEMEVYMLVDEDSVTDYLVIMDGEDITAFFSAADMDEIMYDALDTTSTMPEFDESAIRTVDIEEFTDRTVIEMVIYADALGEFLADLIEEQLSEFDVDEVESIDVADVNIIITKDSSGAPMSMDMDIQILMTFRDDLTGDMFELAGEEARARVSMRSVINAVNEDVEIIWPEAGTSAQPGLSVIPDIPDTFPPVSERLITVPDDPDELDDLLLFIDLFALDSIVISEENLGRQQVNVFPSAETFERLEWFYEVTGIYIEPMEIMQSGAVVFEIFLEILDDHRFYFTLIAAAGGPW